MRLHGVVSYKLILLISVDISQTAHCMFSKMTSRYVD